MQTYIYIKIKMAKTNKKTTKTKKINRIYKNNIDKNYNSISMILNKSNTCMMPLFSQIHIFAVYTETITLLLSKTCTSKPIFKSLLWHFGV